MNAEEQCPIEGLQIIDLQVHGDARGWFKENWHQGRFPFHPVQQNISFNATVGTTRGLHAEPWDKYVSVATGEVFGAWCDLRAGSPTYGRTYWHRITPDIAVFVPRGVANAFQATQPNTAYTYLVTDHWSPDAEYAFVNLADPSLAIPWPIPLEGGVLSEKDRAHPLLKDATPVPAKHIVVLGADGQVGQALRTALRARYADADRRVLSFNRAQLDITNPTALAQVDWSQVDVVINAAAYTQVDAAETDVATAWAVNAQAPALLSALAQRYRFRLVHYSTDYVFDGTAREPIAEATDLAPLNVYGQSKAAGELAIQSYPEHYILRTSWVVGAGQNFVDTMRRLGREQIVPEVVDDQFGRLTFAEDLAAATLHLLEVHAPFGTYHVSNDGPVSSWYDVAAAILPEVQPCSSEQYAANAAARGKVLARRPQYSVLDLSKLKATGFMPRDWRDALAAYCEE